MMEPETPLVWPEEGKCLVGLVNKLEHEQGHGHEHEHEYENEHEHKHEQWSN